MMNPFKALGDLKKMQSQAAQIQKELEQMLFTAEKGRIKVEITGNQKVINVYVDGQSVPELAEVVNDAIKKSQEAAAGKLAQISQNLGLGQ